MLLCSALLCSAYTLPSYCDTHLQFLCVSVFLADSEFLYARLSYAQQFVNIATSSLAGTRYFPVIIQCDLSLQEVSLKWMMNNWNQLTNCILGDEVGDRRIRNYYGNSKVAVARFCCSLQCSSAHSPMAECVRQTYTLPVLHLPPLLYCHVFIFWLSSYLDILTGLWDQLNLPGTDHACAHARHGATLSRDA